MGSGFPRADGARGGEDPGASSRPTTGRPAVGGALIVAAAILGLINSTLMVLAAGGLPRAAPSIPLAPGEPAGEGLILLVLDLVVLAGGIAALRRRRWGLALAGGILGIGVAGLIAGNLLALGGTILVALARREFVRHRGYVAERRLTGA